MFYNVNGVLKAKFNNIQRDTVCMLTNSWKLKHTQKSKYPLIEAIQTLMWLFHCVKSSTAILKNMYI